MITVNLWDNAFRHLSCSVHGKTAKRIRYVRNRSRWDGITIVTDDCIAIGPNVQSHKRIAWLLEPREYKPQNYAAALAQAEHYDHILTHDQELLDALPGKAIKVPFGGCWIQEQNIRIWPKSRNVSHIYSGKTFMPGHRLRHQIGNSLPGVDCYGRGTPRPVEFKEEALRDYRFSIVIENSRARNFFTEKLLDCFAVGTIPIYWGCPNIGDYFDLLGIVECGDLAAVDRVVSACIKQPEAYYGVFEKAAARNLEAMRQYEITDDWIAENVLEGVL